MIPCRQMQGHGVALSVLQAYFPVVATLREFLVTTLDDHGHCLHTVNESDASRFETLLDTSYVACHVSLDATRSFPVAPPMSRMQDVGGHLHPHETY